MTVIPARHPHAKNEERFLQALSLTWNSIAPGEEVRLRRKDAASSLALGGHVEEFGRLNEDGLKAWRDFVTCCPSLAVRLAKEVI